MDFTFTVLGSGAAAPTKERNPSAFLINHNTNLFLIDCAEGTQMQLLKFNFRHQKIDHIFISHLHGDHFFGLAGLISTMHLLGRNKELHIYCPKELEEIINLQLKVSNTELRFDLHFHYHNFEEKKQIFQNKELIVFSFPLDHNIPCCGFIFEEKQKPFRLIKEKLPDHISISQINELIAGNDVLDNEGNIIYKLEELSYPREKPRKFSYCSDTKVNKTYPEYIRNSDLLYHETTFLEELKDRAAITFHSTALQVGEMASKYEINQLIIGHFSARYKNLTKFIAEVRINHNNIEVAEEGITYKIE